MASAMMKITMKNVFMMEGIAVHSLTIYMITQGCPRISTHMIIGMIIAQNVNALTLILTVGQFLQDFFPYYMRSYTQSNRWSDRHNGITHNQIYRRMDRETDKIFSSK